MTSALGCLLVDIRHDLSTMYTALAATADEEDLEATYRSLEADATARLRHEGVSEEDSVLQRIISMRYPGQWRSLSVPIGSGPGALAAAIDTFHRSTKRNSRSARIPSRWRSTNSELTAIGKTPKPSFRPAELRPGGPGEPGSHRSVYFGPDGWLETPVYNRDSLPAGATFAGPAILNQLDSTTVIPPDTVARSTNG